VGSHAVSILGRLVEEGMAGGQTSYCIKDDLVTPGKSSRAFWEAMRILVYIENSVRLYGRHGCKHATILILYLIMNVILFVVDFTCHNGMDAIIEVTHLIITPIMFILSITGLVWAKENAHYASIHHVIKPLVWIYVNILLESLCIMTVTIVNIIYDIISFDVKIGTLAIFLYYISIAFALLNVTFIITHVILMIIYGHEICICYTYPDRGRLYRCYFCCELVFCSAIYREIAFHLYNESHNINDDYIVEV
jgi:hypothetical protein